MSMEIYSIIITSVFGLLSILFYLRTKQIKYPVFVYSHSLLQFKNHPELTLSFNKQKIENLQRAFVLFYNKGKKAIRKNDIPSNKQPRIKFNEGIKILSHKVIRVSDDSIKFIVKKTSDVALEISFDFLNRNDGGIIEILYEGDSSNTKKNVPSFESKLIDTNRMKSFNYYQKGDPYFNYFWYSMIALMFFTGIYSIYQFYFNNSFNFDLKQKLSFGIILLITSIVFIIGSIIEEQFRRVPKFAKEIFE